MKREITEAKVYFPSGETLTFIAKSGRDNTSIIQKIEVEGDTGYNVLVITRKSKDGDISKECYFNVPFKIINKIVK